MSTATIYSEQVISGDWVGEGRAGASIVANAGYIPKTPTENIAGWFDWAPFYDKAIELAPEGSALVEVGVFCGKSLIYLAQKAKAANKGLRVYGVDHFHGSPEFAGRVFFDGKPWGEIHPATILAECIANLENAGVRDDVTLIIADSVKGAELFKPQDCFMVFIDAGHEYEDVWKDNEAWGTKVQRGGLLGGDDYWRFEGVRRAVHEWFDDVKVSEENCWWEVQY